MPKQRRRPSCYIVFILPLMAVCLLASLILAGAILILPGAAEETFGPASARLNDIEQTAYAALLLWDENALTEPLNPKGKEIPFRIESGESPPSITGRLWEAGLIANPAAFRTYLRYSGMDRTLQVGEFRLSPAMTAMEIAQELQDATPTHVDFQVLPGWRLEEIAATLPTSGFEISPDEFLDAAYLHPESYSFSSELPIPRSVEGFLLPGEHNLPREITAEQLINVFLDDFEQQVAVEMREGFERQGLSLYEAVTLASIVEREAMIADEMPMIASVFHNRLNQSMKLDTDPTVQYALGYNKKQQTWWTNPLSLKDLQIDSPYNTYRYSGLPPGPIANPSLEALRAVAFPAQTPYFYFRAGCDDNGRHIFAETFDEHVRNACP